MENKVYQNDVGTEIRVYVNDITDPTTISLGIIKARKPDGTVVDWTGTVGQDTNGVYVSYIIQTGDFDLIGIYKCQLYLELTSGWKGRSNLFVIEVEEII